MSAGCLALNASYEPLRVLRLHRAVRLILDGKAEVLEFDPERMVRSAGFEMPRPTVIRLVKFIKVPQKFRQNVTNTFLFARDNYTCQYCGKHRDELRKHNGRDAKLEREHIQPQSRGGENTWENCTTACTACNSKKANKTPEEAHMRLRSIPTVPHFVSLQWTVRKLTAQQKKYVEMFFGPDVVRQLNSLE